MATSVIHDLSVVAELKPLWPRSTPNDRSKVIHDLSVVAELKPPTVSVQFRPLSELSTTSASWPN